MRISIGCIFLSLAATTFPASSQDFDGEGEGPVEYKRICDVYGTGFYYIPGTDNCLKITGYVRYEHVQNPSNLGVGTVVAGGSESFLAKVDRIIHGFGGGGGFEYGLGEGQAKGGFGPDGAYRSFFYGDFNIGGGNSDSSGSAAIGENGVSLLGFTFAEPDGSTGWSTATDGYSLTGRTKIDYLGGEAELGYGRSHTLGDESSKSIFVWRGSLYLEGLNYDSNGSADLFFDDMPVGGLFQTYDYDSRDLYAGFRTSAEFHFQPIERLTIGLGGNVKFGYHSGEADFNQVTGYYNGAFVEAAQNFHYEDDGFVVGGGLSVKADYAISPTWTVGVGYEFDVVPEVTSVDVPENPSEQPIDFSGESVKTHKLTIRVAASFN